MINTLSEVKVFLGISGTDLDTRLTQSMNYADKMIKNYLGWNLEKTTYTGQSRSTNGESSIVVLLPKIDMAMTFKAYNDGVEIESTEYEVEAASGFVTFYSTPGRSIETYTFDFTAGYSPVPDDVKYAFNCIVRDMVNTATMTGNVSSEKLGDYSIQLNSNMQNPNNILQNFTFSLDPYKIYAF